MNIINKLTLRHLKENKGRTVVTTLGICVSVAMITAVFVALASFLNLFGEIELLTSGNYQARLSASQQQITELKNDERISKVGMYINDETSFLITDRKNDRVGIGEIRIGDEAYISQVLTVDYDGTIPTNENEIAIEQKLLDRNELDLKVGDKIKLSEGIRYITVDNEECPVYGSSYSKDEHFKSFGEKEYTITAILHDNPATRFTSIIRGMSEAEKSGEVEATIELAKINHKSLDVIKDIINKCNFEEYYIDTDYLNMYFAIDENNELMISIISLVAVILVIIMVASVVLIYNAFAMSISERIRYLGMLASVGATKKQKKLSVYFESFILGLVGIPLGMLGGIAGIGITLKALGKKIISTGMIMGVTDNNMQMRIVVPVWVVIGIVLISAFTIFISSYIPSRKASKITPIDALSQRNEIKIKPKKLRSSRLIRLIFGYEGELANKNLKRNGRKAKVITASIALSIILFLCCNYFCSVFTQSVNVEGDVPYQVQAIVDYEEREKLKEKLDEMSSIDNYYCVDNGYATIDSDVEIKYNITDAKYLTSKYSRLFDGKAMLFLNTLDDEDFNELCRANGIDSKDYYGDEYKVLLLNNVTKREGGAKVFTDKIIGCNVDDLFASDNYKITIGALIDFDEKQIPCRLNPQNTISLYEPISQHIRFNQNAINAVDQDGEKYGYSYMLGIETSKHSEVTEELNEYFSTESFNSYYVADAVDSMQTMNTVGFIIQVLVYGFIALILLITVFNIINTISTGVAMRKKEFAMLKSVGTTPKGFNKMIMLESAFYGIKALIFAIPISAGLSYAMYKAMHPTGMIAFEFNLPLYLCVIAAVMVIIGATMLYSVRKLKDDSIVETLKQDIN